MVTASAPRTFRYHPPIAPALRLDRILYPGQLPAALLALLCVIATGCTTGITPPPAPSDPVTVWLVDHGRHPSLIMPLEQGKLVRYAYGDWKWYALGKTGFFQGIDALLLPSQATLGRKVLQDDADLKSLRRLDPFQHQYPLVVSRAQADALRQRLDELFEAHRPTLRFNRDYDLEFVHHPSNYTLFNNCNHETARWLQELGCRVRGLRLVSVWQIKTASSPLSRYSGRGPG
jgi:hypothetical protein